MSVQVLFAFSKPNLFLGTVCAPIITQLFLQHANQCNVKQETFVPKNDCTMPIHKPQAMPEALIPRQQDEGLRLRNGVKLSFPSTCRV
jgi:hypothetical protein